MEKQKLWLWVLLLGNLCMSCSLLLEPIIKIPIDLADFLKGLGASMILLSVFMKVRNGRCFYKGPRNNEDNGVSNNSFKTRG